MAGLMDSPKNNEKQSSLKESGASFERHSVGEDSSDEELDVLQTLQAHLEELEELRGRLSFSMREISALLKVKLP